MSILKNEEYPFPFWEWQRTENPESLNDYMVKVKNFFVENFGFYASDINSYNNKIVCYFYANENENTLPNFCFIHACEDSNTLESKEYYRYFYIAPVLYQEGNNTLLPQIDIEYKENNDQDSFTHYYKYNRFSIASDIGAVLKGNKSILIYSSHPTQILSTLYIELSDERKMIFFKNKDKDTGLNNLNLIAFNACLYYTKIKNDNNSSESIWSWIILARSPASSYIFDIHNTLTYNNGEYLHEYPYQYIDPRYFSSAGGFIPSLTMRKDFLLKLPYFYLGDHYYLENIYYFSKVLEFNTSGPVGSIVSIKDKNYIILQHSNKRNNLYRGSDNNKTPWGTEYTAINTVSLITPIEIEDT